jgi:acyl phosphate:glycerol-3-phosphate acyltransferase
MIDGISWPAALLCLAVGYLLGSIPFGLLITRFAGLGDVRRIGSGNIGATNVLRTGNRWAAALTLVLDGGKGAAAVAVAQAFYGIDGAVIAGASAIIGHILPVWLRFKGGKGVATFIGAVTGLYWPVGLLVMATWLLVARLFRISSLSALVAVGLSPAYMLVLNGDLTYAFFALGLALVIFITHHENLHRLWHGQEPRIGAGNGGA